MAFLASTSAIPRYVDRYGYVFSWRRLWNAGKVLASMGISWATGRPVVWGRPFMMMVEPTNFCNLKCPLCPSGSGEMTRERGSMGLDDFKELIDDANTNVVAPDDNINKVVSTCFTFGIAPCSLPPRLLNHSAVAPP